MLLVVPVRDANIIDSFTKMNRPWLLLLVALAIASLCQVASRADSRPSTVRDPDQAITQASGGVSGHARDGDGQKALAGAAVELVGSDGIVRRAVTGTDGAYSFSEVPEGTYALTATKTGYADGAYGRGWPDGEFALLELGRDRVTAIDIRLWKLATLGGMVIDEAGDPLVGVEVAVVRRVRLSGHLRFQTAGSNATDDRGVYRVSSLLPGEYLAVVPSARSTFPAEASEVLLPGWRVEGLLVQQSNQLPGRFESGGTQLTYATTYAFGARNPAAATVLALGPGEERLGVDIRVLPSPSRSLFGKLVGPAGPVRWTLIRLVPKEVEGLGVESGFEAAQTVSDSTGSFVFHDVPEGQYVARVLKIADRLNPSGAFVTEYVGSLLRPPLVSREPLPAKPSGRAPAEPTLYAAQELHVGSNNSALEIRVLPAPRVSGRLVFEGTREKPTPVQIRRMFIGVESASGRQIGGVWQGAIMPGWADDRGSFETYGAFPGSYVLRAGGELLGWFPSTAMHMGADRFDVPLSLEATNVIDVVVAFTDRPCRVNGTVATDTGAPDSDAMVLLYPEDRQQWTDVGRVPRRMLSARSSRNGAFAFKAVPPGNYRIVSVPASTARDWQTLALLDRVSPDSSVLRVVEGQVLSRQLKTISRR